MQHLIRYTAEEDSSRPAGLRLRRDPAGPWVKADDLESPPPGSRWRIEAIGGAIVTTRRPDGAWCPAPGPTEASADS